MKKTAFRYRIELLKFRLETRRWKFWAWMMDHHPKLYAWASEHLPCNTLPF